MLLNAGDASAALRIRDYCDLQRNLIIWGNLYEVSLPKRLDY